jgi:hypothetical protein
MIAVITHTRQERPGMSATRLLQAAQNWSRCKSAPKRDPARI